MKKLKNLCIQILTLVLCISLLNGCNASKALKGGAIGATAGGVVGGLIGSRSGHTAEGAIIGAALGGTAGGLIGHYMDKQAAELKNDMKGAKVERVGEGIKITFDSGILYDVNSSTLRQASKDNLTQLAKVLNKYSDTNILIEGHTDNTGSDAINQPLSEKRAASVSDFLVSSKVLSSRITTKGYGSTQPVGDNTTVEGRQQNRRVEVAIFANDKLKKAAEKGKI